MNVALYARVSSHAQDVDLSIEAQLTALRDFATKNDHTVVAEYVDVAQTGRTDVRPHFREMRRAVRFMPRPFDAVLVWKSDRLARNVAVAAAYRAELRRADIKLISLHEQFGEGPSATLVETIFDGLAQFYSENLAEDITRGMREAVSRGYWVGSRVPYGFRRVKVLDAGKEHSKLAVDEATAPAVRRIFEMAASGNGAKTIASKLNADRLPSPSGRLWSKNRVYRILRNRAYIGEFVWGAGGQHHRSARLEPVAVRDACPTLVDRAVYEQAQQVLRSRAPKVTPPARAGSRYLLSGILRCGACGKNMYGVPAKGRTRKYRSYVCSTRFRTGVHNCTGQAVATHLIERLAIRKLQEMVLRPDHVRELVRLYNEEAAASTLNVDAQIAAIDRRLAEKRNALQRHFEALESGQLSLTDLAPRIKELRAEITGIEQERARATQTRALGAKPRIDADDAVAYLSDLEQLLAEGSVEEQRTVLKGFVTEIVKGDDAATVYYTLPMPPGQEKLGVVGGAEGTRTPYLRNAIATLSQMSYSPTS